MLCATYIEIDNCRVKHMQDAKMGKKPDDSVLSNRKEAGASSEEERTNSREIDELLKDEKFLPLRNVLAQNGICTLEQLRNLQLWSFMNRCNLYSIGARQRMLEEVNALLYPVTETDESQLVILRVGERAYKGEVPSRAFLRFCDDMSRRYPLQFRLLIGTRMRDGVRPIHITDDENHLQKLTVLSAYICVDLSKEEVIRYAEWICGKCGEGDLTICITEPQKITYKPCSVEISHIAEAKCPSDTDEVIQSQLLQPDGSNPEVAKIEQIILEADIDGVSYEKLKAVSGLTMRATNRLVAESEHIVDMDGRLIHQDAFVDWEVGADKLDDILEKLMQKNEGYVSSAQLYEYAKVEMSMFLNDNNLDGERSVYDMAKHLFEKVGYHAKHYRFSGKSHISRLDEGISSNLDVYRKYAADQGGVFSISALVDYLGRIGMGTGNLYVQMHVCDKPIFFSYESGIFIYAENMHIDNAWMDTVKDALEALLNEAGGHIALRNLPNAWLEQLPPLPGERLWTPLLLQSVLRHYSVELGARTISAMERQSLDTLHAMLVTADSLIQNFGDVVVTWLMDNEIRQREFEAEELRRALVNAGIIHGNELSGNMPKALKQDERFAWDAGGSRVTIEMI